MLELCFYLLLAVIVMALGMGFRVAIDRAGIEIERGKRFLYGYWIFIMAWLVYLSVMVNIGAFKELSRPPSILLFIILPIFTIIIFFHTAKRFRQIIDGFPPALAVYLQSFRIFVELLILGVYLKGLGPVETTFEGRNFDIIAGATAPIIGWLAYNRKAISNKVVIAWNIICLLLLANIVFIFNSMILKPQIWGYEASPIQPEFATIPYLYIAAFYMPLAVFLHVMSIRKSRKRK